MTLTSIIQTITALINTAIPVATGIALIAFFWGIFKLFGSIDNVEGRTEARQTIVWSLIAILVVVTLSGIITVVGSTFHLDIGTGGGGTNVPSTPLNIAPRG